MKVLAVMGISKTGKTTVVETLARELRKRNFTVGSVKEIHFEAFQMDKDGTNTHRHKVAGSQLVTALGMAETDVLYQRPLQINEILKFYDHDYVLLEGTRDFVCPKIITAANTREIDDLLNDSVFAISGKIANELTEYKGIPVINCLTEPDRLTELVIEKVFEVLPNFQGGCCMACGMVCGDMCDKIMRGEAKRSDCEFAEKNLKLKIDGKEIAMVPFVSRLVRNAVLAVVSELDGYRKGAHIEVELGVPEETGEKK